MANELFEKVKEIISEKTGVEREDIKSEAFFSEDLNIDEMELLEIIDELEGNYTIVLKTKLEDIKTVGDLLHSLHEVLD